LNGAKSGAQQPARGASSFHPGRADKASRVFFVRGFFRVTKMTAAPSFSFIVCPRRRPGSAHVSAAENIALFFSLDSASKLVASDRTSQNGKKPAQPPPLFVE
jgi:hypothetical protein